jgi:hypothetical protein
MSYNSQDVGDLGHAPVTRLAYLDYDGRLGDVSECRSTAHNDTPRLTDDPGARRNSHYKLMST